MIEDLWDANYCRGLPGFLVPLPAPCQISVCLLCPMCDHQLFFCCAEFKTAMHLWARTVDLEYKLQPDIWKCKELSRYPFDSLFLKSCLLVYAIEKVYRILTKLVQHSWQIDHKCSKNVPEAILGALWERLWQQLGSRTLPATILWGFWMNLAFLRGGQKHQKSINNLIVF